MQNNNENKTGIKQVMNSLGTVSALPIIGAINAVLISGSLLVACYGLYGLITRPEMYLYWAMMIINPVVALNIIAELMEFINYRRILERLLKDKPPLDSAEVVLNNADVAKLGQGEKAALTKYVSISKLM